MAAPPLGRLSELLEINRAIAAATDYHTLLRLVVERTAAFLGTEHALLLLADESGQARIAASVGVDEEWTRGLATPFDEGIGTRIAQHFAADPAGFAAAPVIESGSVRGILAVYGGSTPPSEEDLAVLSALADQAAIALGNVTHVRRLEEALAQLRETDRRKDEFLGMLSHELRNPLAPIRTSSFVLSRSDPYSPAAAQARQVIQRQTDHLTRLIDDLLDVTRIARGKLAIQRQRISALEVVRRTAEDHRAWLAEQRLRFSVELPAHNVWLYADATRIAQLVGNLLHNAAKFTPAGGEVALELAVVGQSAQIRVRDSGAGIEPALSARLFQPFVQSEQSLARTQGGLGLGLALVKEIAQLHDGSVRAESAGPGRGAEFVVTLPRAPGPNAPPAPAEPPAPSAPRPGSRSVLVVDDNRDAAESLAQLVELFGHRVEVTYDGASALSHVLANPPDVVLCDIGLPGMSGYEVAKAVRGVAGQRIHLVAVSGYAQPEDIARSMDAGFDAHIAKPPDPAEIRRLLG